VDKAEADRRQGAELPAQCLTASAVAQLSVHTRLAAVEGLGWHAPGWCHMLVARTPPLQVQQGPGLNTTGGGHVGAAGSGEHTRRQSAQGAGGVWRSAPWSCTHVPLCLRAGRLASSAVSSRHASELTSCHVNPGASNSGSCGAGGAYRSRMQVNQGQPCAWLVGAWVSLAHMGP
jgi:hypothetical protein